MTARSEHQMTFGAVLLPSGGVRFSLWAPAAEKVSLCLDSGDNKLFLPMSRRNEGSFLSRPLASSLRTYTDQAR